MAKVRPVFVCRACGSAHHRWMGKCPDCNAWDSLEQQRSDASTGKDPQAALARAFAELEANPAGVVTPEMGLDDAPQIGSGKPAVARALADMTANEAVLPRLPSGVHEFDRVLGGGGAGNSACGLVPGSVTLVGGEPGIGKSTLLLQAALGWAGGADDHHARVLYVSSEESAQQVRQRAERVSIDDHADPLDDPPGRDGGVQHDVDVDGERGHDTPRAEPDRREDGSSARHSRARENLFILADANLARIAEQARRVLPRVMIIDSIQMVYKSDIPAAVGSITQLRRCCAELVYLAKATGIAIVLVGHVTKDGELAGPRLLEHLVDTVISFEGDRYHAHRVVRAVKNRFGTTLEVGLFEMTGTGLKQAAEGAGVSAVTLSEKPRPGSAVCPVLTGSRCVLVELQALTATGFLGVAKRKASGLDSGRLAMLIAVLEQHAEMRLADRDVFASAVGGIRVVEPAADLALLLAIAGAELRRAVPLATAVLGEVGLGGEIRPVPHMEQRLTDASRLGFKRALVPGRKSRNKGDFAKPSAGPVHESKPLNLRPSDRGSGSASRLGVELIAVSTVAEAIQQLH
ncbi:MAG: DNA repair protein RadA [Planctomycetota bacterium]|nr:DNA repair protein RadA [Planctomycetota bacterium]